MPLKAAQPHEIRIAGHRKQPGKVVVSVGAAVPAEAAVLVRNAFLLPRFTILHALPSALKSEPDRSLVDDLADRGFDLATLRLSLFMKGHGTPRKPRELRQVPGTLILRRGWVEHDHVPDLCGSWALPATKRDLNLMFHALSSPLVFDRAAPLTFVQSPGGLDQLEGLGWDLRTFDFRVDLTDRKAKVAALAEQS